MRRLAARALATLALLLPVAAAAADGAADVGARIPSKAVLSKSLDAKCLDRMEELATLEKQHAANIAWEISPIAVRGTYIGYTQDYTCALGKSVGSNPAATLRYQEVLYEKSGKTLSAAEGDSPRPVEITEVTEVLVYRDGIWR